MKKNNVAKFRKKPVVIEAIQFTGDNVDDIYEFVDTKKMTHVIGFDRRIDIIIFTLEGRMQAGVSDWIIKGVNGEFYPCKNDIFIKTYDAVQNYTINR